MGNTYKNLTLPLNYPYLIGVYLAINAIPDVLLLGDGPACIANKITHIYRRHDLYSTLLRYDGLHRIHYTFKKPDQLVKNRENTLVEILQKLSEFKGNQAIFLASVPFIQITACDYKRIIKKANLDKPVIEIPGSTLEKDWLDGYQRVLISLAKEIAKSRKPPNRKPKTNNVAIVGYFMDRNEGDNIGNISELKRLLKAIGLNIVSIWLSNSPYKELERIKEASVIISLPHGREAAKILQQSFKTKLIETSLPFGIKGTEQWLNQIGKTLGKEKKTSDFIKSEMVKIIPKLEIIVPYLFLNRKIVLVIDPYYLDNFCDLANDLGLEIKSVFLKSKNNKNIAFNNKNIGSKIIFEPNRQQFLSELKNVLKKDNIDLIIGDSYIPPLIKSENLSIPVIDFGFPSYHYHVLNEEPILGFTGSLCFIQRLANNLLAEFKKNIQKI
jgi:nitrogenase molybdenum-iron protein alpha/beta subunit